MPVTSDTGPPMSISAPKPSLKNTKSSVKRRESTRTEPPSASALFSSSSSNHQPEIPVTLDNMGPPPVRRVSETKEPPSVGALFSGSQNKSSLISDNVGPPSADTLFSGSQNTTSLTSDSMGPPPVRRETDKMEPPSADTLFSGSQSLISNNSTGPPVRSTSNSMEPDALFSNSQSKTSDNTDTFFSGTKSTNDNNLFAQSTTTSQTTDSLFTASSQQDQQQHLPVPSALNTNFDDTNQRRDSDGPYTSPKRRAFKGLGAGRDDIPTMILPELKDSTNLSDSVEEKQVDNEEDSVDTKDDNVFRTTHQDHRVTSGRPPCALFSFGFDGTFAVHFSRSSPFEEKKESKDKQVVHSNSLETLSDKTDRSALSDWIGPLDESTKNIPTSLGKQHRDWKILFRLLDACRTFLGTSKRRNSNESSSDFDVAIQRALLEDDMSSLSRIPSLSLNNKASKESKEKKKRWALDCVQTLFIQGKRQNAIDLAMEHELWAHSMLIASITDDSSYQDVIRAFAASLPAESPLRMLYSQIVDLKT